MLLGDSHSWHNTPYFWVIHDIYLTHSIDSLTYQKGIIMAETNKKICTAEEIHTALVLCAVEYMKQWRSDIVDEKELKRNEMLKELGFTSSKSFLQSEEAVKASRKRMVFNWYYKNFTNCIFVRMEDFTDLLVKYNLTCGRLSSYTGEIPYENLVEIKQVSDKLKEIGEENQYSNKINDCNTIGFLEKKTLFHCVLDGYDYGILDLYACGEFSRIAAFGGKEFKKEKVQYEYFYNERKISAEEYNVIEDKRERFPFNNRTKIAPDELFIAAPVQEMKSDLNSEIMSLDPVVFQLFPYGVVIFSKWGDEANDPILEEKKL